MAIINKNPQGNPDYSDNSQLQIKDAPSGLEDIQNESIDTSVGYVWDHRTLLRLQRSLINNPVFAFTETGFIFLILTNKGFPSIYSNEVSPTKYGLISNKHISFKVSLSEASPNEVPVYFTSISSSDSAKNEVITSNAQVNILPGVTSQTFTVPILLDTIDGNNETGISAFSIPSGGIATDVTDVDVDEEPSLSINDISFDEASGDATFTITLSEVSDEDIIVSFATSDNTATAGSDYTAATGTVTIPAGSTSATLDVAVLTDTLDESNETATLTLSNATNASISDSTGTLTIVDDDAGLPGSCYSPYSGHSHTGFSVDTNVDGTIIAVGSYKYNDDSKIGAVDIVDISSGNWVSMGSTIVGESNGDESGYAVSLSEDGETVAIGAPKNDDGGNTAGHVRIYDYNGSSWVQKGADINGESSYDYSGWAVSLSEDGDTVAIGAPDNDGGGNLAGQVRVFDYNGSSWVQKGADIDGESAGDYSGAGVALSDDGLTVAIGAPDNDGGGNYRGHVRIYDYNGSSWVQKGADINGESDYDYSGWGAVALSDDGNTVAIGAPENDGNGNKAGHVRIYDWNGSSWTQRGSDIDGEAAGDKSGTSVSLSDDGNVVAIGAPENDGGGNKAGQARIYKWNGSNWVQSGNDLDGGDADDKLGKGTSVALSDDGSKVALGLSESNGTGNAGDNHAGEVCVENVSDQDVSLTLATTGFTGATSTSVLAGTSGLNAIVDSNLASNESISGTSSADYIEIQDSANSNVGSVSGNNGDDIIYIKGWGSSTNSSVDGGGGSDTLVINPDIFSSKSNWTNNGGIKSGTIHFTTGGSITINNFETVKGIWGSAPQFERKVSVKADFGSQNLSDITVSTLPSGTSVYDSDGNGVSTVFINGMVRFTVGSVVSGQEQIFTLKNNGPFDFTLHASITDTDTSDIYTTSALIDGIVVGVEYTTSSGLKGLTDQEGNFSHIIGDDVTFNIGGVVLGTATADDLSKGRVFLQDIADVDRTTLNNTYLENMATFLQSLDNNNDAYDNIVISQAIRDALVHESLDLRTASEEEVEQLINKVGGMWVEEVDAMTHVKDMLIKYSDLTEADFEITPSSSSNDVLVDTVETDLLVNEYKSTDSQTEEAEPAGVATTDLDLSDLLDMPGDDIEIMTSENEASSEISDQEEKDQEEKDQEEKDQGEENKANIISGSAAAPMQFMDNLIGEVNQAVEV